jgi:predicted RNase H-like HicB family nuclease
MRKREIIYQYETIFDPNGAGYTITVPKLPGLVTEGNNLKEAREMAKDAIRCYLEAILKDGIFAFSKSRNGRREKIKVAA